MLPRFKPVRTEKWLRRRLPDRPLRLGPTYVALVAATVLLLAAIWYLEGRRTGVWDPRAWWPRA